MSVAFDHRDAGTSEQRWAQDTPWRSAPTLALDMRKIVVFAAHPDDETLGAGGLIAAAAARGIAVSVVVMTDGEASHPDAPHPGTATGRELRNVRRREVLDALGELDPTCAVTFAGLPDGGLRETASEVRRHVRAVLAGEDAATTTVATTWSGDGHRDHRVLGEIVQHEAATEFDVIAYPIWLWHWGDPAEVDPTGWCALPLDAAARARKAMALRRYPSQTRSGSGDAGAAADAPILHPGMLQHFDRSIEVFIRSPRAQARSVEPAWFEERYARRADPWGVDTRWYEQRKREILLASMPRQRYARVLELGCGTGALTASLAARAGELVALDVSPAALASTRRRMDGVAHVQVVEADARSEWPAGTFDAIVLSEVAYYWDEADLDRVLDDIERSLTDDGVLVACHWRHPIAGAPHDGDGVHRRVARRRALSALVHHVEEDFILDVLSRSSDAPSVARETGVLR